MINDNDHISDIIITNNQPINEDISPGSPVVGVTVIDDDRNQPIFCDVINGSNHFMLRPANLTINRTTTLEVREDSNLDYETEPVVFVKIFCSDGGSQPSSLEKSFFVSVRNANEPPSNILLLGSRKVPENPPVGWVVGDLVCQDPDKGQHFTYVLFGENAHLFKVGRQGTEKRAS